MSATDVRGGDLLERLQELTAGVEAIEDARARETAHELLAATLELYGDGLARIFAALDGGGPEVAAVRDALAADGVVASLLLIHGLYPVELETRVLAALDSVRPYLESHGGNVELLSLDGGFARLRLEGSCNGCRASASTLELALKRALDEHAPDLAGLEVEGVVEPALPEVGFSGGLLPLAGPPPPPAWVELDGLATGLAGDTMTTTSIRGVRVLLANVGGTLLAYRNGCASCGSPLDGGRLDGGVLDCPSCATRFQLPLAGRAIGDAALQLVPLPLLEENGSVRVAVGG